MICPLHLWSSSLTLSFSCGLWVAGVEWCLLRGALILLPPADLPMTPGSGVMARRGSSHSKVTITVDEYSSNPTQAFTHYNINQSRFQPPHVHMWVNVTSCFWPRGRFTLLSLTRLIRLISALAADIWQLFRTCAAPGGLRAWYCCKCKWQFGGGAVNDFFFLGGGCLNIWGVFILAHTK